jgi:hypothetical protein
MSTEYAKVMNQQRFAIGILSDERQRLSLEFVENLCRRQRAETRFIKSFADRYPHRTKRSLTLQRFNNTEWDVPLDAVIGPPFMMIGL